MVVRGPDNVAIGYIWVDFAMLVGVCSTISVNKVIGEGENSDFI